MSQNRTANRPRLSLDLQNRRSFSGRGGVRFWISRSKHRVGSACTSLQILSIKRSFWAWRRQHTHGLTCKFKGLLHNSPFGAKMLLAASRRKCLISIWIIAVWCLQKYERRKLPIYRRQWCIRQILETPENFFGEEIEAAFLSET